MRGTPVGRDGLAARRVQLGSAMLEMAVATPLFIGLLMAVVDFGNYMADRLVITSAAYSGARARGHACGTTTAVDDVVAETVAGMVAHPEDVSVTATAAFGLPATPVRRYTVTVTYPRGGGMSVFTRHIDAFASVQATGLALCDPSACNGGTTCL